MSKSVPYMGLSLKNPIIVASGPWSRNAEGIQKSIDAGAGAVVTETISLESSFELCPRVYTNNNNVLNITRYSPGSFEQWEEEISKIQKNGSFVIANIRGSTPSEFAYMATRLERWDVDALELTPFTPIGAHLEGVGAQSEKIVEIIEAVTKTVSIPVTCRLPYYLAERRDYIYAIERAGARGIGTTESPKALWGVDIAKRKSVIPTFGGFSGEYLRPIMLAAVSSLAQFTECDIAAIGGIQSAENILEAIMLGASVAQVGSSIMTRGYQCITEMAMDLERWTNDENIDSYELIRGAALNSLRAYTELFFQRKTAVLREHAVVPRDLGEQLEKSCLADAISWTQDGEIAIDSDICNGCGMCLAHAPEFIEMK